MVVLYIVEGVAGSGKDTLCARIVDSLRPAERRVLAFPEEALLATWLYYFVPGIHELRLSLAERLLRYMKETLEKDPDAAFVLNRFHVSYAVWRQEHLPGGAQFIAPGAGVALVEGGLEARHDRLVEAMKSLPLRIFQAMLPEDDAERRSRHIERQDVAWRTFLDDRLRFHGQESAGESYLAQQDAMTQILMRDGLPYKQIAVPLDGPLDIEVLE